MKGVVKIVLRRPGQLKYKHNLIPRKELQNSKVANASLDTFNQHCADIGDQIFGTRSFTRGFRDKNIELTFARPPWPKTLGDDYFQKRQALEKVTGRLLAQGVLRDEHKDFNEYMNLLRVRRNKVKLTMQDITNNRKKYKTQEWLDAHPHMKHKYTIE